MYRGSEGGGRPRALNDHASALCSLLEIEIEIIYPLQKGVLKDIISPMGFNILQSIM